MRIEPRTCNADLTGADVSGANLTKATLIRANGKRVDYGVLSRRVVTNAGVNAVVDAFQNLFPSGLTIPSGAM